MLEIPAFPPKHMAENGDMKTVAMIRSRIKKNKIEII